MTFYGDTRVMVVRNSLKSGRFKGVLCGTKDLSGHEIRIRAAEVYDGSGVPAFEHQNDFIYGGHGVSHPLTKHITFR